MEVVLMMHVLSLALEVCAFAACSLWIHGSAVPLLGEGTQNYVSNSVMLISKTPAQVPQSDGLYFQPPNPMPSQSYERAPQTPTGQPSLARPSSSVPPDNIFVPILPPVPPLIVQSPAPATSPSSRSSPNEQTPQAPSNSHSRQAKPPIINVPIAPVSNVPAPWRIPESRPPSHSVTSNEPPSPLSEFSGNPPPVEPIMNEPPTNPPEQTASPILASPPSINKTTKPIVKVSPPLNKPAQAPVSYSPTQGPTLSNPLEHSNTVPPPRQFSKSTEFRSPRIHRRPKVHNSTRAPEPHVIPPPSPVHLKPAPPNSKHALIQAPASQQTIFPIGSPRVSPSGPSPRIPKLPRLPPMLHLPPPPPHRGCAPMICTEPYTYGPPETPCVCLLPIQAGLRLNMALYSFFPLVSELASEIASGVFMKQSQVRIMGANEAKDNPDKTIVLIDLLPLGRKFDNTTAYITFQRFWQKKVIGKTELFGDYDVLYVQYPGLPPSPPSPLSTGGIISSKPYPGRNGPKPVEPLGVDVSGKEQKHGLGGIILATIVLSCFVAVILLCAVAWVFVFRYRHRVFQPDPSPPAMFSSQAKSSGLPVSMIGSATNSPSFSLGSSMPPYTGSAKTFTSHDIKRATDFFNEARMIGEGGFGRVYSGVLDDETKVAVKILKRYDQQGGREFLAEVEMLSRLHHRNLVKLIGICVEDPTRCLVYELVPNGSVESHLHGMRCDKERSPLDWNARLKIALGAARALAYLHEDSSPCVIHRDFKASNILLEDDFMPKVSDFGLARTALDENRHISTRVMGTFGYVAPEYAMTGHLLVKSDVYSYGVVLLELLTGRKPVDMSQLPGQENLVSWARPLLASPEGLLSIADQSILGSDSFLLDSISKVAAIASMCVQPEVSNRPFMGEVVQALKLVFNECDENRECLSRNSSSEDLSLGVEVRESTVRSGVACLPAPMLSPPSTYSDYDYRMDIVERDLSMSGLLSPSARFGPQDSESFRRHSSSGPPRTGQAKPIWRMMKRFPRGSVSEHGARFRLWPGSH
ncbi:Protein kinase superfamily protein [Striga hermonthica]|uniref:Protein kinase superfamily protein n=1 Tax=Striga hermonthica TaxID=68872 RepID=A0A9N7RLZ6_STRHE|nr:Protein kinase superfamily protein [Striga hermonthica]